MATINAVGVGLSGASGTASFLGTVGGTASNLTVSNLNLNGNTIISTNTDGNINVTANGTGVFTVTGDMLVQTSASSGNLVVKDGAITSGSSAGGVPGSFSGYSITASKGRIELLCADNAGNFTNILTNTSTSAARTWTFPDATGTVALTSQLPSGAALTRVDDTNVTATLGGSPSTALLAATSITLGWTGTLAVGRGGLGIGTTPTNGQIPIGNGSTYIAASITAGTGISVTPGSGSITIAATGTSISTVLLAGTSQTAAVNTRYISGAAGATTVTLPTTAAIGSVVAVEGLGAGGWILAAGAGQTIQIGASVTTTAGSLTSATATDNVYVVCIVADTTWRMVSTNSVGLTIA